MIVEGFLEDMPFELDHERCIMIPANGTPVRWNCIKSRTPKCSLGNKEEFYSTLG